ncbi:TonB-dependent receptor plug domain-containing protein [Massilia terrae]|uniref:TonB-dependent receptor n=1 Tax=Massilia terrae TaxID=1811224 RepID=A0ABT2D5H2_9BURK|nr:TonB-dependent receptor [Massilia terrae]MCS0660635.1 TonB-dependent receptor [Massilia terrae]
MAAARMAERNASRKFGQLTQIAVGVALVCAACAAQAQEQAQAAAPAPAAVQQAAEPVEQIVVTGSRIRGMAPVGSPVVSVGRGDIEASGAVSTAQMLQEVPQVANLGVSDSSRGQAGGSGNITYGSSVNLRGIGPYATLTLINGHRAVPQGTTGSGIDPSIIPTLALQRVEIVADGASAIYGSDAVAGVVNLILRRNVEGVEAMARYGTADGYNEKQAGALWGHKWKGGQATVAIQHDEHTSLNGQDRDFFRGDLTAQGGGDFRSTQCAPGNIIISGTNYAIPAGGVTKANAGQLAAGTVNKCDNLQYQDILPKQKRDSGMFTFNQDVGNGISLYADGFITRRGYDFQSGALASNVTVPSANPFYVRPAGAPAGSSETVAYSFLNQEPFNNNVGYSRAVNLTFGADINLSGGWKAGALYTWGRDKDQAATVHGLNSAALTAALASTDPATALNVFGGPNSRAVLDSIANKISISPGQTTYQDVQLKADGPLAQLPGGALRAAVGYEGQSTKGEGGQIGGTWAAPTSAMIEESRRVNSVYAELAAPLVSEKNQLPGVYKLDLDVAGRVDRYSDVGYTHNPKVGLNWAPVKGVTVHGSYGTSFRAPGLTQIRGYANGGVGGLYVQNYADPTNGGALRVGVAYNGPNLDLKPETARTRSLGVDFEPAWGHNTKVSLTFFDIKYENQITGYLSDLTLLGREAQLAGTGIITRNPSPALVSQLIANNVLSSGVLPSTWTLVIDGRNKNLGSSLTDGIDFQASTRFPTDDFGDFGVGLSGTYFTRYKVANSPGAPMVDYLNVIFNPMRLKTRLAGTWNSGPWYANGYVNYTNGYTNNLASPAQKVASNTTIDLRLSYQIDDKVYGVGGTTVSLGVVNAFNRKPPFVNIGQSTNGGGGFDPTLTNPIGRIVSLALNKSF